MKSLRENVLTYMLNGKAMIVLLIAGLIERHSISKCMFFKTPIFMKKCEIWIRLSNFATKSYLKNATGVGTSKFANKVDLASLKSEIDQLDIGKLENTPADLSKLRDVFKN